MNANELADKLNRKCTGRLVGFAAIKLRQQQAEIEALKAQIAELTEQNDAYYEESGKTYD